MENIKSLNSIIEKELMLKQLDGGQKLQELLATAEELYENGVSAQYHDIKNNKVVLQNEVILLGDNITRLKFELLGYGINAFQKSEESKGMKG